MPGQVGRQAPSEGHVAESSSFLKKRTKKRLRIKARSIRKGRSQTFKGFCFFFSKKNMLS
jgi:hypothetical protein